MFSPYRFSLTGLFLLTTLQLLRSGLFNIRLKETKSRCLISTSARQTDKPNELWSLTHWRLLCCHRSAQASEILFKVRIILYALRKVCQERPGLFFQMIIYFVNFASKVQISCKLADYTPVTALVERQFVQFKLSVAVRQNRH